MSLASTLAHAQHFHACAFVGSAEDERAVIDPVFFEDPSTDRMRC